MRKFLMKKLLLCFIGAAVALLSSGSLRAQDISGDWQAALKGGASGADRRLVVHISKNGMGGWSGMFYTIDLTGDGIPIASVTVHGSDVEFSIEDKRSYEGKLSADGASIKGRWLGNPVKPLDFQRATKETLWPRPAPHVIFFVTLENYVKLEVLDWGGSGPSLVFLAGGGDTAHVFDAFAPQFTDKHHVYAITRRGFGDSSSPAQANGNYSADKLADDVLAVIDSLKLNRPVLVGHSIAGEEMSSIGSRHPDKVADLIYLDAGYWYAYYDRSRGDVTLDSIDVRKKLEQVPLMGPPEANKLIYELLQSGLPQLERELRDYQRFLQSLPAEMQVSQQSSEIPIATAAMISGEQKYTDIRVPILAIFAISNIPALAQRSEDAAKEFETGVASARVVRLQNATHYVFQSNEADVRREMNAFLALLK
jgi:pimeloyl-ACP methyl ester carboxylesterase